ncbi:MAG: hypothetical protein ACE362_23085 [Phaeodactylibacter xiamenensis]|uniref:Lipoprotein n=1 Tax=Phaeodactylibacter xiamenensis TaxID=1524460 RepID=A0A098S873_9BACT|nr:hypothetical protein [Phaeodactylibacter xiamenensis]KGE87287.1 hypothetical protein IX84_16755 [Phaeodactylibacter xiamenensis]MCR9052197.1 hypothetical protein [bacterium]
MKKILNTRVWILTVAVLMGTVSCTEEENILRGTTTDLEEELLTGPIDVQLIAAPEDDRLPMDLAAEVTGPDAGVVYMMSGEKQLIFKVSETDPRLATLSMDIRRVDPITEDNPVKFTLRLTAEGYEVVNRVFHLTDASGETCGIRLTREDDSNVKAEDVTSGR